MNFKEFEDGLQVEIEIPEKVQKSLMRHLPALHQISVVRQKSLYLIVIPGLTRNLAFSIWIPPGVYPVLHTGRE